MTAHYCPECGHEHLLAAEAHDEARAPLAAALDTRRE